MIKARIMIVDDEELILRAYKKELVAVGYEIICTVSAKEAIEIIKSQVMDILLVDLVMPGINGVEVCKIVKKISPDTEVVLMSGYIDEMKKNWIEFIKAGGRDFFLRKPLGERELLDTIKTILIERGQGEENVSEDSDNR